MNPEFDHDKYRMRRSRAMQKHHDVFTMKALTQPIDPQDFPNMRVAIERRLNGEVQPLEQNGVFFVLED